MVKDRVRVKEPTLLQKPWVSPRFRMTWSRQGRQRLKIFLPLDRTRKESFLPSAKIRSKWRSHQIFGATTRDFHLVPCVTHMRAWISHRRYHPYLLDCYQSDTRSITARASMGIWRPCFFFSSIASAIHTCSIAIGGRLRIYHSRVLLFVVSFRYRLV